MSKFKKIFFSAGLILFNSNFLFADGYVSDINSFKTRIGQNFSIYVKKATKKRQLIGIGYSEKSIGIKYTINTSLKPLDNETSNFYTSFIVNDWRFEVEESYDILQNNGFNNDSFQIRPALGFGIDLKSSNITSYLGLNFLYSLPKSNKFDFLNNLIIGISYKYFYMKDYNSREVQIPNGPGKFKTTRINEDSDKYPFTKNYINFYISYKF